MLMMSLEKFEQAEKELKDVLRHEAADGIESMDTNTLNAVQSVFKFMDASTELIKEQTRTIYEMEKKIDEILLKVSGNTAR